MSSSNLNIYAGAFLGTVFAMMTVGILGEAIFHEETPENQGFAIAVSESAATSESVGTQETAVESILPLLATADATAGEKIFKKCAACHTSEEGGANKVGPNLWNIVNRPTASHEGFKYSSALQDFAASSEGGQWTFENLDHFITKPKDLVPGTAMGFAGVAKIGDRADLIAYLHTLSNNPAPLPDANAAPAADPAASGATDTTAPEPADATPADTANMDQPAAPADTATMDQPAVPADEATTEQPAEGTTTGQ